ncbi:MAG TPA: hypothetical protein VFK78_03280 [Gemmatimonadales bacterium]|nr:hypothetical protein [Gemmatimonadales bacterium]
MNTDRMSTVPLPLALHLASYTVVGLFCAFAGALNLIDPGHILRLGLPLLLVAGFSWGYVFGILMGRKEVIGLGILAGVAYTAAGVWKFQADWRLGALLLFLGLWGLGAVMAYRKWIVA